MDSRCEKGFTFIWNIKNFLACWQKNGKAIKSPPFTMEGSDAKILHLEMYPTSVDENNEYISCYFGNNDLNETVIDFSLDILINHNTVLVGSHFTGERISNRKDFIGICWSVNKQDLDALKDTLTVRCIIKSESLLKKTKYIAETKIGVDTFNFKWPVPIYSSSKIFKNVKCRYNFRIEIQIIKNNVEFFIFILSKKEDIFPFGIVLSLSLLDIIGEKVSSKKAFRRFGQFETSNDGLFWKFPVFLNMDLINSKKQDCLRNDVLTLLCEISVSNGSISNGLHFVQLEDDGFDCPLTSDSVLALREDFSHLFDSQFLSDVKFHTSNEVIPAHKNVLAARSPVFRAMFEQDMKKNQTGIIDVPDIDVNTLKLFLNYIYTGKEGDLDYESTLKLLMAAHKYQVTSLEKVCFFTLENLMSSENVCELLLTANMIGNSPFRSLTMDFIKDHSVEVLKSEKWDLCIQQDIKVATEVIKMLSAKITN